MTKYFVRNGRSWGTGPQRSGEWEKKKSDICISNNESYLRSLQRQAGQAVHGEDVRVRRGLWLLRGQGMRGKISLTNIIWVKKICPKNICHLKKIFVSPGMWQWWKDLQLRVRAEAGWLLQSQETGKELWVRNAQDWGDHHHYHYHCYHYHHCQVSYPGACREPCAGMDSLGHFQAFGSPATNYGENYKRENDFSNHGTSTNYFRKSETRVIPILLWELVRCHFNCQDSVFTISSAARLCCAPEECSTREPRPAVRLDLTSASESEIFVHIFPGKSCK